MFHRFIQGQFLLLMLIAFTAQASIHYVDGLGGVFHYSTINAAYVAAIPGDTLLIGEGHYYENMTIDRNLVIIGSGIDSGGFTQIDGYININSPATVVKMAGLVVSSNSTCVRINGNIDVDIIGCHIINQIAFYDKHCISVINGTGSSVRLFRSILYVGGSNQFNNAGIKGIGCEIEVFNCVITGSNHSQSGYNNTLISGSPSSLSIQNTCFLDAYKVFGCSGLFPAAIRNCIFYDWKSGGYLGDLPSSAVFEFNASSGPVPVGDENFLLADNPFIDYANSTFSYLYNGNLRLSEISGSPCIDTGHPNLLDLDGTRSDLGIYGGSTPFIDDGAPNYPFVSNLTISGIITAGQPLSVSSQGRIGREY